MSSPGEVATQFYEAFTRRDGAAMAALYAPDATFSDGAFPGLDGRGAGAMWRMLCELGKDLKVEPSAPEVQGDVAKVTWHAHYTFSATGKKVHNIVHAAMTVKDGRIVAHTDSFDFYRWAKQALGVPGVLLGWTGFMQKQVQKRAGSQLARYRQKNGL